VSLSRLQSVGGFRPDRGYLASNVSVIGAEICQADDTSIKKLVGLPRLVFATEKLAYGLLAKVLDPRGVRRS